jgi:hypothetical protein
MATANPNVCDYIESIGVDPKTVRIDGFTEFGYYSLVPLDPAEPDGPALLVADTPVQQWNEWPEGFDWNTMLEAIRADYHASRK